MPDKKENLSPQDQEAQSAFKNSVDEQKSLTTSIDPSKKSDPQKEPLGAQAEKPATATTPLAQEGANRAIEGARSNLFGDTTSARGSETVRDTPNVDGLHGRDGGFSNGSPNNPAPDEATEKPEVAEAQRQEQQEENEDNTSR
jgi:hypothetical protein